MYQLSRTRLPALAKEALEDKQEIVSCIGEYGITKHRTACLVCVAMGVTACPSDPRLFAVTGGVTYKERMRRDEAREGGISQTVAGPGSFAEEFGVTS